MRHTSARRGSAVVGLVLALSLGACSHSSDNSQPTPTSPTPPVSTETGSLTKLTKPDAKLKVTIGAIHGGFGKKKRPAIKQVISRPIASWIDGGFLSGRYPRRNFSAAFKSWTSDAHQLGRKDNRFTTNAALGRHLKAVVADRQTARLYIFGFHQKTGGATARVYLRLTGERLDGTFVHIVVKGDLYLTPGKNRWRIFGYDLDRMELRR